MSSKDPKPTIECAPDGPYVVKDLKSLSNSKGQGLVIRPTMALCRCGASETKPFCDGTHATVGFSGEKAADRMADRRDTYVGESLTIHDNRGICAHAGVCTDRLPAVWRMKEEPWIDPDGAEVAATLEIIQKCPSGALSCTLDGSEYGDRDREPRIQLAKDGPYEVSGGVELLGVTWGEGASREHYTLCRCGGSKNKPFCDGSHWYNEFKDEETGPTVET